MQQRIMSVDDITIVCCKFVIWGLSVTNMNWIQSKDVCICYVLMAVNMYTRYITTR